jgi:hypothetical protein
MRIHYSFKLTEFRANVIVEHGQDQRMEVGFPWQAWYANHDINPKSSFNLFKNP